MSAFLVSYLLFLFVLFCFLFLFFGHFKLHTHQIITIVLLASSFFPLVEMSRRQQIKTFGAHTAAPKLLINFHIKRYKILLAKKNNKIIANYSLIAWTCKIGSAGILLSLSPLVSICCFASRFFFFFSMFSHSLDFRTLRLILCMIPNKFCAIKLSNVLIKCCTCDVFCVCVCSHFLNA